MQLGMVGLGRMGSNLVRRLLPAEHECVVYDVNADTVAELAGEGATGTGSLDELVAALDQPRAVWVMVPAGQITEQTVTELGERLDEGDVIIDGGNSYYRDDIARASALSEKGIHYVDVGTSGGVWGLKRGYSLMIGGDADVVRRLGLPLRPRPHRGDRGMAPRSVIASWLLDLTAASLFASPELQDFSGQVSDSGEGRWTAIAAVEEGVPAPVLLAAVFSRFVSRDLDHFADQALSAMRSQFGGHVGKPAAG
jgi:6-phosphogluconate dehydrogenase